MPQLGRQKCSFYVTPRFAIFIFLVVMATGSLEDVPEVRTVSEANTQFGLELFRKCGADRKDENLFLAPFSISTALSLTQLGAGGATADQMARALKWPSEERPLKGFGAYLPLMSSAAEAPQQKSYTLAGAQRIYVSQRVTLKQQFNSDAQTYFGADAKNADFAENYEAERKNINTWVSEKTSSKIKDLLPPGSLNPLTAMVLVQATYFKGFWMNQFDPKKTMKAIFKTPKGKIKVDMMSQQTKFPYTRSMKLNCSAIELPYARGDGAAGYDLSMIILLPDQDDGLSGLEASMTASNLAELRGTMTSGTKINLQLPRFSIESSLTLKQVLVSLGMVKAFSEADADFTGLVEDPNQDLYISEVYHKAVVEVNEEGSEAAAATGVVMMMRSMPVVIPFVADHPFLFFIIDKRADIVLFMGHLVSPVASGKPANQEL